MIIDDNIIVFYEFLNSNIKLLDIQTVIYGQPDLEQRFGKDVYMELIDFDFKDKNATDRLRQFIVQHIVSEGELETWKLKSLLQQFLTDVNHIDRYLNSLYQLYCDQYQGEGKRKYQYKFLENLGLNHLYWVDEGYLKTNFGNNWEKEYQSCVQDFEFYHHQLQSFAAEILTALNEGKIQISNDRSYSITEDVKAKLETGTIYQLKHPEKQDSR